MVKERKITDFDEFIVQYLVQNSKMAQKMIQDCISGSHIKGDMSWWFSSCGPQQIVCTVLWFDLNHLC